MGKSNKKVKNDRINTLRKQYDAYLEEDKKRRERNEYILGKLDKMRSTTALVPISTKASYYQDINLSDVYVRPENGRKRTTAVYDNYVPPQERQNMTSDILNKHFDEPTILKEISKRYILIPKRRMPVDIEYACHKDAINDNDWRSKYNILDNLKKQEKEGISDTAIDQNNEISISPYKDSEPIYDKPSQNFDDNTQPSIDEYTHLTNVNKNIEYNSSLEENDNKVQKCVDFDVPENNSQIHDKTKPLLQTTLKTSNVESKDNTKSHNTDQNESPVTYEIIQPHAECTEEKEKHNSDVNEKYLTYQPTKNIKNDMEISEENTDNKKHCQESMHLSEYNQSMPESTEYKGYENDSNTLYSEEIVSDVMQQESGAAEMLEIKENPSENVKNQNEVRNAQDLPYPERIQVSQYGDTGNNPSGHIEEDPAAYDTPQDYDPAQDNIPVVLENTEHSDHVDHNSEINAFEAEQKEMFYSEQTGGDAYAYNQGDGNTEEYTTENYEPNDQYYFEGAQQEQSYVTNVNEHEEATERYDPHYNQQYEGSYENQQPDNITNYDNVNTYEQQQYQEGGYENQQFDNVVNYETQQENANIYQPENVTNENELQETALVSQDNEAYDQHLYTEQPDTQEHIEQQLITEEGYIDNPPINTNDLKKEHENETESAIDVSNPVEPMTDPKFS